MKPNEEAGRAVLQPRVLSAAHAGRDCEAPCGEGMVGTPHLSCIGSTRERIREVIAKYRSHGIRHVIALRGDLPSGSADVGEFRYASELVQFIGDETGDWFHIDVAAYPKCHPQARSAHDDPASFKRKIAAGANSGSPSNIAPPCCPVKRVAPLSASHRHLPCHTFRCIVERYHSGHRVRDFSCANPFRCMAFARLTYRESLRDIETRVRAHSAKLYHLGIRGAVERSAWLNPFESQPDSTDCP